ncbi:photosystem reaction center subunit H [Mesorhizobium sp. WSM4312]|nr:photosystem reaction center subunit H [Mesorhizobium sp. WSM4312]PBC20231.1 photosystem reaction center subunit H [Mesorhizobium sp. WSM4311]TRC78179.1 PRC-barrel domain containing protein [Mesorhizobium sp. WSM4315]TRC78718.1 PRC-barrel domain containing protein [Mesorhizobium sp. WSM4307]TRC80270.1 PRC-barrel domain containing protein [Mesorhizobium sp. WSM4310]TRC97322.1 PRC-barrel domain containing protein [Mesorhizobium sp. WSM4305]
MTTAPADNNAATTAAVAPNGSLVSKIIGATVYNGTDANAQTIGKVNDVLLAKDGKAQSLIIGVGGFLGIGEKNVAFDFNKAQWAEKDGKRWLVIKTTKEDLQAQPNFDTKAYDPTTASNTAPTPTTVAPDSTTTAAVDKTALTAVPIEKVRAEDLVGTTVYGANDAKVGKIGDVVLTGDKKVDAVLIDVGGFLGIGAKEVAVGMDNLKFMTDKSGNKYLYTNFTKEQFNAQPAYEKGTYASARDKQRMIAN